MKKMAFRINPCKDGRLSWRHMQISEAILTENQKAAAYHAHSSELHYSCEFQGNASTSQEISVITSKPPEARIEA